MPEPVEEVFELRARPGAVLALAAVVVGACVLIAAAEPAARVWCILGTVGAVGWAAWRLRHVERFRVDAKRGLLERPGAPPLEWYSAREVIVKDPEQEAPNIATVMVDLGRQRWVPVYFGHPDAAARVAGFLRNALPRSVSTPPEPPPPKPPLPAPAPDALVIPHAAKHSEDLVQFDSFSGAPARPRIDSVRGIHDAALAARRKKAPGERVVIVIRRFDDAPGEVLGEGSGRYLALLQRFERNGPPPKPWLPLTREDARAALGKALGHELAYGYEHLPAAESDALAGDFLRLFDKDIEYFGVPPHVRISAGAQFDTGIVVRDRERVGLCWFESDSPGR